MLEEVVVHCWEFRWMKQNFVAQFFQLLKHWLCYVHSSIILEKNWALSVGQCQLQTLQFLVHLIDLLSTLLRCNGFARIQKAIVVQTDNRPANSDHEFVCVCKFVFRKCFGASPQSNHWAGHPIKSGCPIKSTFCHMSQSDGSLLFHRIREDSTSEWWLFSFSVSSWSNHLLSFFTFSICFKCWMTDLEWLTLSFLATSRVVVRRSLLSSPSVSYSAHVGWNLRICISIKTPGDADAAGLWTTLRDTLPQCIPQQENSQEGF